MGRVKITKVFLDALLECNIDTGILRWKRDMASTVPAGSQAGSSMSTSTDGYCYIVILGSRYPAHHLIWLHAHGELPTHELDHIDRNKRNNAITNLRLPDKATQVRNTSKVNPNGKYLAGVTWCPRTNKFRVFHKREFYGYHTNLLDAVAAKFAAIHKSAYTLIATKYK